MFRPFIRIGIVMLAVVLVWFLSTSVAHADYTQNDYRLYVNVNAQTPRDPWPAGVTDLGENTGATGANGIDDATVIRIRMNINVSVTSESGDAFKLQYKANTPCSSGTYTDIGGIGSGSIWRGFDNSMRKDGSKLSRVLLGASDVKETYEESNNSVTMPRVLQIGEDGEWDWVIENNGATAGTTYCFRMVKSAGTALEGYNDYPTIQVKTFNPESQNWRWYDDEENEIPSDPLESENTQPFGQPIEDAIKLRLSINEIGNGEGVDQKMKLEFSTSSDFSSDINTVTESGSCTDSSLWCYADGTDADDDAISTLLLTDSGIRGVHNESGTSATTFDHPALTTVEYEFTIESRDTVVNGTVYYFRAFNQTASLAVPLASGETYPNIKTRETTLSFTLQGLASSTMIDGYTTTIGTTTTTIPFGTLAPNNAQIGAQRLTVSQDGEGYVVYLISDGQLRTSDGDKINPISGTNAFPSTWGFNADASAGVTGAVGYHPDDDTLTGGSTRFQVDDTWAQFSTTRKEIIYTDGPIINDVHDILFQVEVSGIQPTGSYTVKIQYIVVPTF